MEKIIEILNNVGVIGTDADEILKLMQNADLNSIEVLQECSVKELQSELGLTLGKAKALAAQVKNYKGKDTIVDISLPSVPADLNQVQLEVTGNTKVNTSNVLKYLQFGVLYSLGVEDIGKRLFELIKRREEELDEPNPANITKLNLLIAKFSSVDSALALALNTGLGYFQQRHDIYSNVQTNMVPACITLINDILQFRLNLSDIDSLILSRTFGLQKISSDISLTNVVIAAEDFSIKVSKDLRGDNLCIIEESMKMYKELLDILDETELQKYLGAKDKRDLLLKLGVKFTPKDIQMMQELPVIIYQFLYCIDKEEFNDSKILVQYLQKVWQVAKILDWSKFKAPSTSVQNTLIQTTPTSNNQNQSAAKEASLLIDLDTLWYTT